MGVLNIGLICSAGLANTLAGELKRLGFHLKAIWTDDVQVTVITASQHEIPFAAATASDEVLLRKEVELIIICGVPHLHSRVSVKALGIGKHVVCGAPIGLSVADTGKMVTAALYYPQLISLAGLSLRHLPVMKKLKDLLRESVVGVVDLVEVRVESSSLTNDSYDWQCEGKMGGGALNVLGSQFIDVCQFLLDRKVERVGATLRRRTNKPPISGIYKTNADDFCHLKMWLNGGCLATLAINSNFPSPTYSQEISLFGSKGWLRLKDNRISLFQNGNSPIECGLDQQEFPSFTSMSSSEVIFLGFRELLSALKNVDEDHPGSRGDKFSWQTGPLASTPSFSEGKQIQEVVHAAILSNDSDGGFVKVAATP